MLPVNANLAIEELSSIQQHLLHSSVPLSNLCGSKLQAVNQLGWLMHNILAVIVCLLSFAQNTMHSPSSIVCVQDICANFFLHSE